MFDDKPVAPQGQAPQNLPLGEPEDLFAQTETGAALPPNPPVESAGGGAPIAQPSALDAGILKPIEPTQPVGAPYAPSKMQVPPPLDQSPYAPASLNTLKEPTMSRGILTAIIIVVALLFIGGAAWWVYRYLNVPKETPENLTPPLTDDTSLPPDSETEPPQEEIDTPAESDDLSPIGSTSTQPVDETILFGEAVDTDGDGLDDQREEGLGTNPQKVDTDEDELSDGDEVIIWNTDPLNADTDGDSYVDGKEIKAGFSPKGPGKLFEVKATTSTTSNTSSNP